MAGRDDYDASKDQLLDQESAFRKDGMELFVEVYSYNGGSPKLQLSRNRRDRHTGDMMFAKLGRLSYDEFVGIAQAVKRIKDRGGI